MSAQRGFRRVVGFWRRLLQAAAFLLLAAGVHAADRTVIGGPVGVPLAAQSAPETVEKVKGLRAKASKDGTVRVIVGVSAAFTPEGSLAQAEVPRQRKDIAGMQEALLAILPSVAARPGHSKRFETIPFMALTVTPTELETLLNQPEVNTIQEDFAYEVSLAYSVPLIYGGSLWGGGFSGVGQVVAILDTGVDKNHQLLSGKVSSEACYSTNYSDANQTITSVCPGGVTASTAAGSGVPCSMSKCDHGTHVAGIVAGKSGINGSIPGGVAKDANLIAIQVFSKVVSSTCSSATPCTLSFSSDQISGLERVYALRGTYNIASVNMSIGGGRYYSQSSCDSANLAVKAAIDTLRAVGIATVIASGNESYTDSTAAPGCISSAVSVGATSAKVTNNSCLGGIDAVSCYSNSASFLSLLAPGSDIYSSIPGSYAYKSGTSMATPHVAGAWAVLKQKKPAATVTEVLGILESTGVPIMDSRNGITKKRISVKNAVNSIGSTTQSLSVTVTGLAATVTSSPAGISCQSGATCSAAFATGATVTLTAAGGVGSYSTFSGDCSGVGQCVLTMSGPRSVSVNTSLNAPQYTLTVSRSGSGAGVVTRSGTTPPAINCGTECSGSVPSGQAVSLTATPFTGSVFSGWGGGTCTGTGACSFNMAGNTAVTATFSPSTADGTLTQIVRPNLSGAQGTAQYFSIPVPAGATNLVARLTGGSGDADLYLRKGVQPTLTAYDCRPYTAGNEEECAVPAPQPDTYHVMVHAYSAISGVTLTLGYSSPPDNVTKPELSGAQGSMQNFSIAVPAGATNLVIKITGGTGDVDLYTRRGQVPTLTTYDCRPFTGGNEETCTIATPLADTYYVMLHGYSSYSGVTLTMRYTPGTPPPSGGDIMNIINLLLLN